MYEETESDDSRNKILIISVILGLIVVVGIAVFFLSSKSNQREEFVDSLTDEAYEKAFGVECKNSADKNCWFVSIEPKVDKYCASNKLSANDCIQLKSEVIKAFTSKIKRDTEKMQTIRDELRKSK